MFIRNILYIYIYIYFIICYIISTLQTSISFIRIRGKRFRTQLDKRIIQGI